LLSPELCITQHTVKHTAYTIYSMLTGNKYDDWDNKKAAKG